MTAPRYYTADDIRAALSMPAAIAAMRDAFAALASGHVDMPVRTAVPADGGATLLVMPARVAQPAAFGAKLVTVFPQNAPAGRPVVQAVVVLIEPNTGAPLATLEGTSLTAIRTGAASGLATDLLALRDVTHVAILGAGVQARTQLEAVRCVRPISSVAIWSRTRAHADRFASELRDVDVRVARSAADAAHGAGIICCATSASTPMLASADVAAGTHVNAVGSFTPDMIEIDPTLVGRARVVVDQREAALAEAGEVIAAVRGGLLARDDLAELGAVVVGAVLGRRSATDITMFKSVGLAVQDLVAAARIVDNAPRAQ